MKKIILTISAIALVSVFAVSCNKKAADAPAAADTTTETVAPAADAAASDATATDTTAASDASANN